MHHASALNGMHRVPRVHPMLHARTNCAHCTHALCTLHARTHALCTLHAHIVHAARTRQRWGMHALCVPCEFFVHVGVTSGHRAGVYPSIPK